MPSHGLIAGGAVFGARLRSGERLLRHERPRRAPVPPGPLQSRHHEPPGRRSCRGLHRPLAGRRGSGTAPPAQSFVNELRAARRRGVPGAPRGLACSSGWSPSATATAAPALAASTATAAWLRPRSQEAEDRCCADTTTSLLRVFAAGAEGRCSRLPVGEGRPPFPAGGRCRPRHRAVCRVPRSGGTYPSSLIRRFTTASRPPDLRRRFGASARRRLARSTFLDSSAPRLRRHGARSLATSPRAGCCSKLRRTPPKPSLAFTRCAVQHVQASRMFGLISRAALQQLLNASIDDPAQSVPWSAPAEGRWNEGLGQRREFPPGKANGNKQPGIGRQEGSCHAGLDAKSDMNWQQMTGAQ